jgi:tRNA threonylcarbamoyladenosine biosynthesis protein TsaE
MQNRQSSERIKLASTSEIQTKQVGRSLASSLSKNEATIWLRGELGAGKTTFVQGLAEGLGIDASVTSPTYALENRFDEKLLHLDLYRLEEDEARRVVDESEDFPGVRAVEWSERMEEAEEKKEAKEAKEEKSSASSFSLASLASSISIHIKETSKNDREIEITFNDVSWPSRDEIVVWRKEMKLPEHIGKHCDAVAEMAKKLAEELLTRGTVCRPEAIFHAALLHDLMRFVDFKPEMHKKIPHANKADPDVQKHWESFKEKYGSQHEAACAQFLIDEGYPELAEIIRPHGLLSLDGKAEIATTDQKLLFYADKRIKYEEIVSLDERFDDFVERYEDGDESEKSRGWREKTKKMEEELFGNDIP